ncbi:MAG: DUF1549 domain-containing protein [Pirellulales bacterium]
MPPPDADVQLTDEQVELIRRWINEDGRWREHWSFEPPVRPELPEVSLKQWPRTAVDRFILARLEREGLRPSPEASRETLIRRVTDLTGLPPSIAEIDAFLLDNSDDAYEKVVDRLLSSRRYGEHMARYWLDAARYGDTHGLHLDNVREMWPYRNWVIDAFNRNLPFDEFTVEQSGGRPVAESVARPVDRHGIQPLQRDDERRGRDRRGVSCSLRRRSYGDDGRSVDGADGRLRRLPRTQIRPDQHARVLQHVRVLQQRRGERHGR